MKLDLLEILTAVLFGGKLREINRIEDEAINKAVDNESRAKNDAVITEIFQKLNTIEIEVNSENK